MSIEQVGILQQNLAIFLSFSRSNQIPIQGNLKEAQRNLVALSRRDNFIQMCCYLLLHCEVNESAMILTASMLKDKFIYQFNSIVQEHVLDIVNGLRQVIAKFNNPKKHLLVQLSLCVAYLYLNCADKVQNLVVYVNSFVGQGVNRDYFFKILELITQEISNGKLVMDDETRELMRIIISKEQQNILILLNDPQLWNSENVRKEYLIGCFSSWIGLSHNQAIIESLHQHFLLGKVFECMVQGILPEQCSQCLLQILYQIHSPAQDGQIFTYLANNIYSLLQCTDHLLAEMQLFDAQKYIKVLCQFGVRSTAMLLGSPSMDQSTYTFLDKMVGYLLKVDGQIYDLCHFWTCFLEGATKMQPQNPTILQIAIKLYGNLIKQSCYDWDLFTKLDNLSEYNLANMFHSAEDILDRRSVIKGVNHKIGEFMGKQAYLEHVMNCMLTLPKEKQQIFLPFLQTYIFSLKKNMKNLPRLTQSVIKILYTYKQLSPKSVPLLRSYLNLMSSLMTVRQKNQQFIQQLFVFISQNFNNNMLSSKAQKAFCQGCQHNPQILCKYIDDLFGLLRQYPCKRNLIRGISLILNSNPQTMRDYLPEILKLQLQMFNNSQSITTRRQSINSIITIIRTINQNKDTSPYEQTVRDFLYSIWGPLKNMIGNPENLVDDQDRQVERCVKLLKIMMRCIKLRFIEFLEDMFNVVIQAYRKYPVSSYIYLLEVSITVFYQQTQFQEYFKSIYQTYVEITSSYLNCEDNLVKYQYLVDDFMGMNKRFFNFKAKIVLQSGKISQIIQLCINHCFGSQVPKVAKAAYQFFQTMFMVYWRHEMIKEYNSDPDNEKFQINSSDQHLYGELKIYISQLLPIIIQKMMSHLISCPQRSTIQYILDSLQSQVKAFPQENCQVWGEILVNIPLDILTKKEKTNFYNLLSKIGDPNIEIAFQAEKFLTKLLSTIRKRVIYKQKRTNLK